MAYENYINRVKVIHKNMENLIRTNKELAEANRKLREASVTEAARWTAELRVARKEIEEETKKERIREANIQAIT